MLNIRKRYSLIVSRCDLAYLIYILKKVWKKLAFTDGSLLAFTSQPSFGLIRARGRFIGVVFFVLFSAWPKLMRPPSAHLAVLWLCARRSDGFWGRLFNSTGKMLLSHQSCTSLGCSATAAVFIAIQTGHCKCQQILISPSRNKTANVVKLLMWMQLYWNCSAYLVCLCHVPLELSHGTLIRAALRRDRSDSWGLYLWLKELHGL